MNYINKFFFFFKYFNQLVLLVGAKTVPRGLPGPVGVAIDGADAAAEGGWEVGVHFYGGSKGGGGV